MKNMICEKIVDGTCLDSEKCSHRLRHQKHNCDAFCFHIGERTFCVEMKSENFIDSEEMEL
jgi:hypothetical protein